MSRRKPLPPKEEEKIRKKISESKIFFVFFMIYTATILLMTMCPVVKTVEKRIEVEEVVG